MKKDFWVKNITKRNVTLRDLNLTIKAGTSVNLLDYRRYGYKLEQLEESSKQGSLYIKRSMIILREKAPVVERSNIILSNSYLPSKERSGIIKQEEYYEELNISDEQFAEENLETIEIDQVKPKRI